MGDKAVRCPWCGAEMELDRSYKSIMALGVGRTFWYFCYPCGAVSPRCDSPKSAYSAAMTRCVEPNRVLTMEEASQKLEAIEPIYIEICGFGGGKWFSNGDDIIEAVSSRIKTPDIDEYYGTEWRAWLRRPTDEEREAVKWENTKEKAE